METKGITVYGGSSAGSRPEYSEAARALGAEIARLGLPMIYGGGHMGLMGAAASGALSAGGEVVAVIPQFMINRGWNDPRASRTIATDGMHPRKQLMASMARGAVAMPGGVGTFEELTELITWRQLGLYSGNIVVLNIAGYYDSLLQQVSRAISDGFLPASHAALFDVTDNPVEAARLAARDLETLALERKF